MGNQIAPQNRPQPSGKSVATVEIGKIPRPVLGASGIVKIIDRAQVKPGPGQARESLDKAEIDKVGGYQPEQGHQWDQGGSQKHHLQVADPVGSSSPASDGNQGCHRRGGPQSRKGKVAKLQILKLIYGEIGAGDVHRKTHTEKE